MFVKQIAEDMEAYEPAKDLSQDCEEELKVDQNVEIPESVYSHPHTMIFAQGLSMARLKYLQKSAQWLAREYEVMAEKVKRLEEEKYIDQD
mmetsp:Transcript_23559/g.27033  ORF Transcript_23559/g.27033 Transcript_23559/m.27033 type:complete len:91 (+) Transcript_23559:242-514(+)